MVDLALLAFFYSFFSFIYWIALVFVIFGLLGGISDSSAAAFWLFCLITCLISYSVANGIEQKIKENTPIPISISTPVNPVVTNYVTVTNSVILEK